MVPPLFNAAAPMRAQTEAWRRQGLRVGLVPTMGYLHEGHLSLVDHGRQTCQRIVVSIFVNPLQFGPKEDFAIYPRDLQRDLALLEDRGVDAVFHPAAETFYPPDFSTYVEVEKLSEGLCGPFRPGHFRGVATVVAKLFNAVRPDLAVFGQKDYQQTAIIRRMVRDLDMGLDIQVAPTLREADGLAMSSRNIYLTPEERQRAPVLYRALGQARQHIREGEQDASAIEARIRQCIQEELTCAIDYISVVDPLALAPVQRIAGPVVIALAVRLSRVRLIDNIEAVPTS